MMLFVYKCSVVYVVFMLNLRNLYLEIYLILFGYLVIVVCVCFLDNINLYFGVLFNSFYLRLCLRNL